MLRQLVRHSTRTPITRVVLSRSLHSPFAVLSTESNSTTSKSASETLTATSQNLTSDVAAQAQAQATPEKTAFDGATEVDSGSRVYVVSHPDPSLGAPFGVQLGACPVGEPFAH